MFQHVSIQLRVILTFAVMAIVILTGTLVTWLSANSADREVRRVAPEAGLLKDSYDCSALLLAITSNLDDYVAESDKDKVSAIGERRVELLKKLTETLLRIAQRPQHEADVRIQQGVVKAQRAVERYDAMAGQAMFKHRVRLETAGPISQQVLANERDELLRQARYLKQDVITQFESLQSIANQQHQAALQSVLASASGFQSTLWITAFVAIAVGIGLSIAIARSLVRPLKSAKTFMHQLGLDLTPRLELDAYDEANDLAYGINDLLGQYDKEIRTLIERAMIITRACETLDEAAQSFTLATQRHVQEVSQAEDMFLDLHLNVKDLSESLRKVEGLEKVKNVLQEVGPTLEALHHHSESFIKTAEDARKEMQLLSDATNALRDAERRFVERTASANHLRDLVTQLDHLLKARIESGHSIMEHAGEAADDVRVLSMNFSLETYRDSLSIESGERLVEQLAAVSRKMTAAAKDVATYVSSYENRSEAADQAIRELEKVTQSIQDGYADIEAKSQAVSARIDKAHDHIQRIASEAETLTESVRKFSAWFDQQSQAVDALKSEIKAVTHLAKTHGIKLSRTTEVLDGTLLASKGAGDIGVMQQENVQHIRQAVQDFSTVLKKFKVGKSY